MTRAINQILSTALQAGLENPRTLGDDEAKQIEAEAIDGDGGEQEATEQE